MDAPLISIDEPGSFGWRVFHERHPVMIERLRAAHPFGPDVRDALSALLEETTGGVVAALDEDAPDHDVWTAWTAGQLGRPWSEMSFLWAESYFFRKLLAATGYFAPGPWRGVDPFAPMKRAELSSAATAETLKALDALPGLADADRDAAAVAAAVWGNQADLAFQLSTDASGTTSGLVTGSPEEFWSLFAEPGEVHLVADNAAGELAADLVLIDRLLTTGRAAHVVLHVKPTPYYVSDATPTDVLEVLHRLTGSPGEAGEIGRRVEEALRDGRIAVRAHRFFCAPKEFGEMPDDLRAEFASAAVTIFKGDLNYRRLVGDRHWPATTPFADVVSHFPGPVATLRVLKSEVVVGLPAATVSSLDAEGQAWRTQGSHALIQTRA
ncbi:damage-control phosphatase ARMT1 family protein [Saccharopolyspora mangrovi]|uniref:Damage-control phosphatase ARMT1 family protein n=1 Tax=Saccharopolyspora mangrovi TaxID=3082379 RepID=A0ABU6AKS2_9PSEU|nr:damage-control phosphatase ARMT1 family protein [Saccharopolyspora sp. S2-29]MEB3371984.1 damage-control phosphatase ARMT1 family protein [Saccharopolyspora sp. S2-29]